MCVTCILVREPGSVLGVEQSSVCLPCPRSVGLTHTGQGARVRAVPTPHPNLTLPCPEWKQPPGLSEKSPYLERGDQGAPGPCLRVTPSAGACGLLEAATSSDSCVKMLPGQGTLLY